MNTRLGKKPGDVNEGSAVLLLRGGIHYDQAAKRV